MWKFYVRKKLISYFSFNLFARFHKIILKMKLYNQFSCRFCEMKTRINQQRKGNKTELIYYLLTCFKGNFKLWTCRKYKPWNLKTDYKHFSNTRKYSYFDNCCLVEQKILFNCYSVKCLLSVSIGCIAETFAAYGWSSLYSWQFFLFISKWDERNTRFTPNNANKVNSIHDTFMKEKILKLWSTYFFINTL